ncbi:hypothetical protein Cgig2_019597 [Carnegiea gigantea]|uniref:non-specific serine/threonine protein kinase n=1 Tax=Carnegiea gigantea TaxID=171969 RepID=A0A9Q1KHH3_9CARY|nr:hypothetical protein Cgig2_019597 [Carnegiea gigantea]
MGSCCSTPKVTGSNSNRPTTNTTTVHHHRKEPSVANSTAAPPPRRSETEGHKQRQPNLPQIKVRETQSSRRQGVIPCGKRTDFGYEKDFDRKYSIGKLLGHGQFGYTYVATDKSNGDRVAVKKIDKSKMVLSIAVEDVKREVKILKALTGHENVVQFYNAFEDENYVYIVMETRQVWSLPLVRGSMVWASQHSSRSGSRWYPYPVRKDSRYTEKDAAVVVRQMLKVAAQCHLHGLVHRDMKPENFLFKSPKDDSPLKATDFGLSDFIRPGPESDVWSIGVITYILLCGRRPFWDKTEDGIFKEVLRNKPDFRRKPWHGITDSAKDFVKRLLVKDPRARLTAAQALSHPWVREGGNASNIPIDISVLHNMRQFVKYSRMKQFALRALASTLNEEELADLRDQFDAIDVDKSGTITLEEMRLIDSNTDGLVDFTEFVAATLHVHQLHELDNEKWQLLSQAAFEKFDVDRDGFITPEELRMHTGLKGSVEPLLEEADIDKDGRISLQEFRRLLRSASISSRKLVSPTCRKNPRRL